jgi:hypothetical protein
MEGATIRITMTSAIRQISRAGTSMIQLKRASQEVAMEGGLCILAERLWPRG